jgi:anaerobic nitric oxide reductase flavorubredoxin
MDAFPLSEHIHCLHADIETKDLFEGIWPIPHGVSLNSYLVKGQKTALIDLVRDWEGAPGALETQLKALGSSFKSIDYMILNHLEPDHTGFLAELKAANPGLTIIATAKGIELVKSFYKITDGLKAVKSGDSLDLGNGLSLSFEEAPNVHWPETMVTFEPSSGTLFSCDAFGSFGKLGDRVFDDQFSEEEKTFYEKETLRYYANIVSSFSTFVDKAIAKCAALPIKAVAPSHGIVWRKEPARIVELYKKYASYLNGPREKEICVIWGSMYGNTKKGLDQVIKGIEAECIPYSIHRVPDEDVSYALADAWKCEGLVLAMPTYEYKMFPPMAYVLDIFARKHVTGRRALRIGSWGWIGGAKKEYDEAAQALKLVCAEPHEWAGQPSEKDLKALYEKGRAFARSIKEGA